MLTTDKVQPRRRAPGATEEDLESFGAGEPMATALTAPAAEVAACTEETARLSDLLKAPEMSAEDRTQKKVPGNRAQAERALLNASNLSRAPAIATETGVDAQTLLGLLDKRTVLGRARTGGLLVQSDAADGKLMLGSLFRFIAGKVDDVVAGRLTQLAGTAEGEALSADTADIAAKKAAIAGKASLSREDGEADREELSAQIQTARDEVDYLAARRDLGEGREAKKESLAGATRHAEQMKSASMPALSAGKKGRRRRPR